MRRTAVVLAASSVLVGAAQPEPMRVEWKAHPGCPDRDAFWSAVVSRSARIRRPKEGESAHEAVISITRVGARSVGTIAIDGGTARRLQAPTCAEVVDALALVAVVSLDPEAFHGEPPVPASASTPVVASSSVVVPEVVAVPVLVAPVTVLAKPPVRSPATHFAMSFGPEVFAAGAGWVVSTPITAEIERARWSLRLGAASGHSSMVRNARGPEARFTWTTLRLDGCAALLGGSIISLRGCVGAEGGALSGAARNVVVAGSEVRPWFGPTLGSRWLIALGEVTALEFDATLGFPLFRDQFAVDPDYDLFRPSAVFFRAAAALRVRFL